MLALVTGATSGMGLEYCRQLALRGHNLVMVSNQQELLDILPTQLSQQYGINAIGRYQDLATPDAARQLYDWCCQQGLKIDILINNAGMFFFHELTPDYADRSEAMLALHVLTPTRLCALFGEDMKLRRQGYILNVSSLTAQIPAPGITLYAATKAYLKSYSKSLYFEMRPYGVGVTTVLPAAVATPLYNLNPKTQSLLIRFGIIRSPQWLVRRALRGMFRHRHYVKPGIMNYLVPILVKLLPNRLETHIWQKLKLKQSNIHTIKQ
ncbi:MAG: SDR family NAD(P)-dependent oxidoreductase [Bacteroidales bacterium]|nr:SDR family NAD(P)-dependent oxidoreductase [Bacteroidales bacterium]